MAPEVIKRSGHGYQADIWSLGCLVIEMIQGRPPWSEFSREARAVLKLIAASGNLPTIPDCSENCTDFIRRCLKRNPLQRPTAEDLLLHPFINDDFACAEIISGSLLSTSKLEAHDDVKNSTNDNIRQILAEMQEVDSDCAASPENERGDKREL